MTDCRLIIDPPKLGAENMAIDEAILAAASNTYEAGSKAISPTLRLYRWSQPTLSLGYFQRYEDRAQHAPSLDCDCVRRHSGGGAIMHHHELTYSLTIPVDDRWSRAADDLYQKIHRALIDWYRSMGVTARLSSDGNKEPFLCFQRRSDGDILVDANKITGSAQRRHRGALLQHGSILLRRSEHAPELAGMYDLGATINEAENIDATIARNVFGGDGLELSLGDLTHAEKTWVRAAIQGKFGNSDWTKKR